MTSRESARNFFLDMSSARAACSSICITTGRFFRKSLTVSEGFAAAMLMAGLDGIQNRIDPGEPLDKNIYELPPEELKKVPNVAGSLSEALDCLEKDHAFLLKGDVFTKDLIETYIELKRKEYDAVRLRPHPFEFQLYYDV